MLFFIEDLTDPLLEYIKDDPVRPEIPKEFRVCDNRFVSALIQESPCAMVCVCLQDFIPEDVKDLVTTSNTPTTAVFYTIWSYVPGAGADLLLQTVEEIKNRFPSISRFVTLSPKTATARRFHLKNGAIVLRENENTINYEYPT